MTIIKYICITLAILFTLSMVVSLVNGAAVADALIGGLTLILLFVFLAYRADKAVQKKKANK